MFDALKAVGWRNRFILPALRQAALRNGNIAALPDFMIIVELWLWAVFFRFSGEYRALSPDKQAKLREEAFRASFHDYKNAHKDGLLDLMRKITPEFGLRAPQMALAMFEQYIRPTFEHCVIEAQQLQPLHEMFDLAVLRRVVSKVHPAFLEVPGVALGEVDADRQHNLKLVIQVASVGQAQLYAFLTGMLIPADTVLVDEHQIPDLIDVFVSYARTDIGLVADLVRRLERSGVKAWYDQSIQPETQFDRVINDRIAAAKLVLAVWSPASVGSKWVRAESLAAFNADKLLQLRIGRCEIPTPFNIVQTIEVSEPGLTSQTYALLIDAVRRQIGAVAGEEDGREDEDRHEPSQGEPWYFDHKVWREAFIIPALGEAEPILFMRDTQVGHAAVVLLEAFLWGQLLTILAFKIPEAEFDQIIPMFRVTAATQHWDAAKERSPSVQGAPSMDFIVMFDRLVMSAVQIFEDDFSKHGKFESPPLEMMKSYLSTSEFVISKDSRRAAFPQLGADGDALLGIAALAGSTVLLDKIKSRLLSE